MTAIAAVVHDGRVYVGGDSAGVSGWTLSVRADLKVFTNGPFVMGFTSSFRMGQLLRYAFVPPAHPNGVDDSRFMVTTFVDAVRDCLKAGGYAKKENEREEAGSFIVGYHGRLFIVCDDYQIAEPADGIAAVGTGDAAALGALFATPEKNPTERILLALAAAERHNMGVRGPFHVEVEPARPGGES
ncbi:MAG: hypothetical protein IMZ67_09045 [Acidobacteria bacterium]|nr:hypothetical protein [Acidobacteriota bacterium]